MLLAAEKRDAFNSQFLGPIDFRQYFIDGPCFATVERQKLRVAAFRTAQRATLKPNGEAFAGAFRLRA